MSTLTIADRTLSITPVKVRDLPRFLASIEPVAQEIARGDIAAAILRHADHVIEAAAIGAGVERAWLDERTPDELIDIAAAVLEVNADFFVRRVAPRIEALTAQIAQTTQTNSGGTSGSQDSLPPGSATQT